MAERFVFLLGFKSRSLMLQRYAPGVALEAHTDGLPSVPSTLYLLKRAKSGGEFHLNGKTDLRQRIKFDAGKERHGFTEVLAGYRWTLIFQRDMSSSLS